MDKKGRKNKKSLTIENVEKTTIIKVAKVLNTINLNSKYSQTITNANMDAI